MWITNGAVSDGELGDSFLVYARTGGPDVKPSKAISLFLVEKGMAGFELGQRLKDKCGMRASMTAELVFDNVNVPAENLVGAEGGATVRASFHRLVASRPFLCRVEWAPPCGRCA